ncbi:MAG: segregation/condensation protein A [Spirochaetaceae bacterium]|jgi:segregation and condensation protein A|nr:segregation/condensation protein A [Spirochaetaceae bacterium]
MIENQEKTKHPAQIFRLKDFEGPIGLLFELIKKNNINLYDIPIAEITEQYLDCLKMTEEVDLDDLTDFYAMAANLIYIKSRMLLPVEYTDDEDIDDPRSELVGLLIEYQKFKKLSALMEEKEREAEWIIERKKLERTLPFEDDGQLWEQIDVWDLLKTFSNLTKNLTLERIMDMHEEVSINEKITLIKELLETKGQFTFTELFVRHNSLLDVVCAFLAILEAVKLRIITIFQNRMWGDIQIRGPAEAKQ